MEVTAALQTEAETVFIELRSISTKQNKSSVTHFIIFRSGIINNLFKIQETIYTVQVQLVIHSFRMTPGLSSICDAMSWFLYMLIVKIKCAFLKQDNVNCYKQTWHIHLLLLKYLHVGKSEHY